MTEDTVDSRVDSLYRRHPSEFVAARKELADELRPEEPSRAEDVRTLRKPTLAAWALNLVAQDRPEQVAELRAAGSELRGAQASAVGGGSDEDLRRAEGRRRELVQALTDAAVEHAGEGQRDRIEATLEAASVDDAVGDDLSTGRLVKPHPRPSGIGDLATMLGASATRRPRRGRARAKGLERRMAKIEAALARDREQLGRARERLADAQEAVESAERRLADDEEERDRLQGELDEASG